MHPVNECFRWFFGVSLFVYTTFLAPGPFSPQVGNHPVRFESDATEAVDARRECTVVKIPEKAATAISLGLPFELLLQTAAVP